eukprot:5132827-Alexandrium_andersonii.AAC.1
MAESRLKPDAVVCSAAVSTREMRGQWLPALKRLRSTVKSYVGPDVIGRCAVMSDCGRAVSYTHLRAHETSAHL